VLERIITEDDADLADQRAVSRHELAEGLLPKAAFLLSARPLTSIVDLRPMLFRCWSALDVVRDHPDDVRLALAEALRDACSA
jgi:hypothetical protein